MISLKSNIEMSEAEVMLIHLEFIGHLTRESRRNGLDESAQYFVFDLTSDVFCDQKVSNVNFPSTNLPGLSFAV